jgi:hypothetical protein
MLKDGIRKAISVGYRVYEYIEKAVPEEMRTSDYVPTYIAIDWEPYEISSVTIPADYKAGVRADDELQENEIKITNLNPPTPMTDEEKREMERLRKLELEKNPAPATVEQIENARKAAVKEEQTRTSEIIEAVRASKLKSEFAEKLIKDGTSLTEARAAIITEYAKEDSAYRAAVVVVDTGMDDSEKVQRGIEQALMHRLDRSTVITELGRDYVGGSLGDMARMFLEAKGEKVRGLDRSEIAKRALQYRSGGAMSSTDFPFALGNVFNNMLLKAYNVAPQTFRQFCKQSSAKDFRDNLRTRVGDLGPFKPVAEGGEYEMASFGDKQEKYKVAKFGMIVPLTWEAIVNDTLDAFSRIPGSIAMKARQMQSKIVWDLITGNVEMSDGKALFHTDHDNLDSSGNAIDIAALTALRQAMRLQQDDSSDPDYLDIEPKYLIVSPVNEGLAYQFTSANYVPNEAGNANPKFNQNLITIVEPRLMALNSGKAWILAADPNSIDTIEYAFLEGQGELFTETRQGFDVDGIQMKARMVFGAGAIDYRGLQQNVGA